MTDLERLSLIADVRIVACEQMSSGWYFCTDEKGKKWWIHEAGVAMRSESQRGK